MKTLAECDDEVHEHYAVQREEIYYGIELVSANGLGCLLRARVHTNDEWERKIHGYVPESVRGWLPLATAETPEELLKEEAPQ